MRFFAAIFAALLIAAIAFGARIASMPGAAFALFASLTLGGALVCLFERSAVRSASALLASFLGTAGLFLLLGSDLLAMAQVLICAGGMVALFLFAVMLAPDEPGERRLLRLGGALLFLVPLAAFVVWRCADVAALTRGDARGLAAKDAERIGVALLDTSRYAVAFEVAAVILSVALVAAAYFARRAPAPTEEAK